MSYSDPFGLCPKSAGGDGKTDTYDDCPKGTSGYNAHQAQVGKDSFGNEVAGVYHSCKESGPCATLAAVGGAVAGGWAAEGASAAAGALFGETAGGAGEVTGATWHGIQRIVERGVKPADILSALREGESMTVGQWNLQRSTGEWVYQMSHKFVGPTATVILNNAGEIISAYLRGW